MINYLPARFYEYRNYFRFGAYTGYKSGDGEFLFKDTIRTAPVYMTGKELCELLQSTWEPASYVDQIYLAYHMNTDLGGLKAPPEAIS